VKDTNGNFPLFIDDPDDLNAYYCTTDWDGDGEMEPAGIPCAVFKYEFTGSCTYSQMAQALKDPAQYCPDDQWDILNRNIPATWQETCVGDIDTKWYKDDCSIRVLESQPNVQSFFIITSRNVSAQPAPVMVKSGKNMYYGTLLAPDCWEAPPNIAQTEFTFSFIGIDKVTHTGWYRTNQTGTEILEIKIDGVLVPPGDYRSFDEFKYCVEDSNGDIKIGDKWYTCHRVVDATNLAAFIGNNVSCPWFLPPNVWIDPCKSCQ
jgi:hypothetical protein